MGNHEKYDLRNTMNKMNILTFLGLSLIFLGGVGAILLAIGQARSSFNDKTEIISTLKQEVSELKTEREKLNLDLESRDKKIQEQNAKIESLSNKLVDKSEYIEKYISGGNSYPHIELGSLKNSTDGGSSIMFMLKNTFDLPIYNIVIEAYDYDNIQSKTYLYGDKNEKAIKMQDYVHSRIIEFRKDLLSPKTTDSSIGLYPLKPYSLYIIIHTRNKVIIQKIAVIKYGDQYYKGYIVYNLLEKKILEESNYHIYSLDIQKELKEKLNNIPNNLTLLIKD